MHAPIAAAINVFNRINNAIDSAISGANPNKESTKVYANSIIPMPPTDNGMFIINIMMGTAINMLVKLTSF
ncbi:hypothetical protein MSSD14B_38300 [Marinobacter salsuginis]|uniref:Uncharacterized protein n=1 Tax=Marinobacter salsuginis TaxID=418719 RepID=A0A5M3Q4M9_9GAMM|nr:hypothetical protein MSSD14B_38300 [Marinobacter salsuginis]